MDRSEGSERIVRLIRIDFPDLAIIARASDEDAALKLKAAGASEVIPEVLEGSLMIAAEALVQCGTPVESALKRVRAVRSARYPSLRGEGRKPS